MKVLCELCKTPIYGWRTLMYYTKVYHSSCIALIEEQVTLIKQKNEIEKNLMELDEIIIKHMMDELLYSIKQNNFSKIMFLINFIP